MSNLTKMLLSIALMIAAFVCIVLTFTLHQTWMMLLSLCLVAASRAFQPEDPNAPKKKTSSKKRR